MRLGLHLSYIDYFALSRAAYLAVAFFGAVDSAVATVRSHGAKVCALPRTVSIGIVS